MSGNEQRELPFEATESQTLIMCGSSMRENRETPQFPPPDAGEGRSETAKCRTSDMHDCGESDDLIVPNEAGEQGRDTGGGVCGGKRIDQGERFSDGHAPGAEPGECVDRPERRTAGCLPG